MQARRSCLLSRHTVRVQARADCPRARVFFLAGACGGSATVRLPEPPRSSAAARRSRPSPPSRSAPSPRMPADTPAAPAPARSPTVCVALFHGGGRLYAPAMRRAAQKRVVEVEESLGTALAVHKSAAQL